MSDKPDALIVTDREVSPDMFEAIREKWIQALAEAPFGFESAVQSREPMITEFGIKDGMLQATKISAYMQIPRVLLEPDPDWTPPRYAWHVRARRAVRSWWYSTRRTVGHWIAPADSCDHDGCC